MDQLDTPAFQKLMEIEDPYSYRDRLTMPKLIVNAAGDQFFLPDSSQLLFRLAARREPPALRGQRRSLPARRRRRPQHRRLLPIHRRGCKRARVPLDLRARRLHSRYHQPDPALGYVVAGHQSRSSRLPRRGHRSAPIAQHPLPQKMPASMSLALPGRPRDGPRSSSKQPSRAPATMPSNSPPPSASCPIPSLIPSPRQER